MGTVLRWLYNNKTKLTGFLLAIVAALQANAAAVQALMTHQQFAVFTLVVALIVAGLGFLNSHKPTV